MKVLQYVGKTATRKIVRKEDFEANGVTDQGMVEWDVVDIPTKGQAWVSDEAAKFLQRAEPNSWQEVPEEQHTTLIRSQAPEGHEYPDADTEEDE